MAFSSEGGEPPIRRTPEEIANDEALRTISQAGWGDPEGPGSVPEAIVRQAEELLLNSGRFSSRADILAAVDRLEGGHTN